MNRHELLAERREMGKHSPGQLVPGDLCGGLGRREPILGGAPTWGIFLRSRGAGQLWGTSLPIG